MSHTHTHTQMCSDAYLFFYMAHNLLGSFTTYVPRVNNC